MESISFTGKNIPFSGASGILRYKVTHPKFPWLHTASFSTMGISATGQIVGGLGLLYEAFNIRKTKQLPEKDSFSLKHPVYNAKFFENFVEQKTASKKPPEKKRHEINPKTKFGKIGLGFARVGIAVAGVAGVFNGISMGLPILAIGEGVTTFSTPIIETLTGLGIFGIGLAAINLARVLDTDPRFKIDKQKYSVLDRKGKLNYIGKNISDTGMALVSSIKVISSNMIGLLGEHRKKSLEFFKTHIFSLKQKEILVQEFINNDGKVVIKRALKASPYLMHLATAILTVGSLGLIISGLFKNHKAQKTSMGVYNVGNSIDNIALIKWGVEKRAISTVPLYKISGSLSSLAGLSILSSQPGVDKEWGRGLMWTGVGLLLSAFTLERYHDLRKALSPFQEPLNSMVREWRVDLSKIFSHKELTEKFKLTNPATNKVEIKSQLDWILDSVNRNYELKETKGGKLIANIMKHLLNDGKYLEDSATTEKTLKEYTDQINLFGTPSDYKATFSSLRKYNEDLFGLNPIKQTT